MEQKHFSYKKHSNKQTSLNKEMKNLLKGIETFQKERFPFWHEVVGDHIARIAVPVKNKKGVLFVKVPDPVWRFELTRGKYEIISKINEHLKKKVIKDLVFI